MSSLKVETVNNFINNEPVAAISGKTFVKLKPADGAPLCKVADSDKADVGKAAQAAIKAKKGWAKTTPVARSEVLRDIAILMRERREEVAEIVHLETGKSVKEALGEVDAAIEQGFFMAGEGRRMYGKTTTSAADNRTSMTVRTPVGVAGLIIAANTPIANVAWKVFPALVCGNTVILKPSEDTPMVAWAFAQIAKDAGLPPGALNIVNGFGETAGAPLVEHEKVALISFTGSTPVGKWIAKTAGGRMAKVFLELGGKNPFVVCDDADLKTACKWVLLSSFSNAGQRCAASSRIIIFESVYEEFKNMLVSESQRLSVGAGDSDDYGAVINERQLNNMIDSISRAKNEGAKVITGGERLTGEKHAGGYFLAPTIIENVAPDSELAQKELFGPIASLFKVSGLDEAIELANDTSYGLTACIHTSNVHRAMEFCHSVEAGVVNVNAGTYGSEPHMPFGGVKHSGNGLREPGTEALDVYCEWKNISLNIFPDKT
ncbi:Aldehyde dehydrogenase B [hydrothermal vent metagenome]|uniref:Aldehyde dehydrogenase B n=1 Tax=hydrothermal vent metagenome TaxID=652676 RepID=A0A3B1CWY0_9ZZZZ